MEILMNFASLYSSYILSLQVHLVILGEVLDLIIS